CEEGFLGPSGDPATSEITAVLPNSNPVGLPVLVKGSGFTDSTELFFDRIKATIETRSDSFIAGIVPQGVAGLGVTVSVRNPGEVYFDLEDAFDVLSAYPSDIPQSPPSIIFPSNISASINSFTTNQENWLFVNVYETDHQISMLRLDGSPQAPGPTASREYINDTIYIYPASGQIGILDFRGQGGGVYQAGVTVDETSFPPIEDLQIERSNGWKSDAYQGEFFKVENFVFPESFNFRSLDYSTTDNFLLLNSKSDGRQFLFVAAACDPTSLDCN
ncbi:MAG: IPT/TIG domain-containing protein, partial [Bacteroidota bacterium]